MLSRRKFLGFSAAGAAALLLPELVVPKKTFFLPPVGGWKREIVYLHSSEFRLVIRHFDDLRLPKDAVTGEQIHIANMGSDDLRVYAGNSDFAVIPKNETRMFVHYAEEDWFSFPNVVTRALV